eukprot:TRINITY_DN67986_c5_g1_i3.p2 TRINITY_DN67986_c5_g1~~TRINITY_DN67986_c5_g1_i3.p2  ORF type:complete len:108 (-),score=18.19 TRINITY_DN67986_c5_g1_i3:171-494(-)
MWRVLTPSDCCLDIANLGFVKPNWMVTDKGLTYRGLTTIENNKCRWWSDGTQSYYELERDPIIPCQFNFGNNNPQNMIFNVSSYVIGEPPAHLFQLPPSCVGPCKKH